MEILDHTNVALPLVTSTVNKQSIRLLRQIHLTAICVVIAWPNLDSINNCGQFV